MEYIIYKILLNVCRKNYRNIFQINLSFHFFIKKNYVAHNITIKEKKFQIPLKST